MNVTTIKLTHTSLASRRSAARVRREVEEHLRTGDVTIDLAGVTSVSSSYADELFGVLAQRNSLRAFGETIRLSGVSAPVLTEIAAAIQYRLNHDAGDPRAAERAARDVIAGHSHSNAV